MNYTKIFRQFLSLTTVALILTAVALRRDAKVWGHEIHPLAPTTAGDTLTTLPDGTLLVNTTPLSKEVIGYAGPTPLNISVRHDSIIAIEPLENAETPGFFADAVPLLDQWKGKTLTEAETLKVDAVSGATYSSEALKSNVQLGLQYLRQHQPNTSWQWPEPDPAFFAVLFTVLSAAILPLLVQNKTYRLVQQILNVVVLGFWTGTFLNFTALLNYVTNGIHLPQLIIPTLLLITAFVYPFFGKKSYYCSNVCPFGALQDLASRTRHKKWKIAPQWLKRLTLFREILWAVLMLCLWGGVGAAWIEYEVFTAFIFSSASWAVLAIGLTFTLLSIFVSRPYCRFVCPTGTLFKIAQHS